MGKEDFQRKHIHDKFLDSVIVRLDYTGVRDLKDLVKLFDEKFPKTFKGTRDFYSKNFSLSLRPEELEEISGSVKVPVNVIENIQIVRYEGMKNVACDVLLDITKYYMCMEIKRKENYDGLDKYIEPFKGAVTIFSSKIPYFQAKRLGLRKVRQQKDIVPEKIDEVFESFVYKIPEYLIESPVTNFKSEYVDYIAGPEFYNSHIQFNVRRILSRSQTDGGKQEVYSSILDIDAYYSGDKLSHINEMLDEANKLEFNVYKSCMNYTYLKSINDLK